MSSLFESPFPSDAGSSDNEDASSRPPSPFTVDHPRPDLPPALAAQVLHRAVAAGLAHAGFEGAEEEALDELEGVVVSFFGSLLSYAQQLAELGRRHQPTLADVVKGCEDLGVGGAGVLLQELKSSEQAPDVRLAYKRPRAPSPPPLLLPSDDESDPLPPSLLSPPASPPPQPDSDSDEDAEFEEVLPLGPDGLPLPSALAEKDAKKKQKEEKREKKRREKEKRMKDRERRRRERKRRQEADPFRGEWLPVLPPKHSWKQTPVYPQSAAPPPIPPPISQTQQAPSAAALQHLSTLRARLNDSQLVAASLRNLIRRTGARGIASAPAGVGEGGKDGAKEGGKENDSVTPAPTATPAPAPPDDADVVDYESEWYGVRPSSLYPPITSASAAGGKRRIRVVTVGAEEEDERDEEEGEGKKGAKGGREWMEGSRVGGAAKRRRWVV
ncbi:hypothetical protein JCM8547_000644 [Rhodosporidiobolus lusitaniae]